MSDNLMNNATCIHRSLVEGFVEFRFKNISLIEKIIIEGKVDLTIELFVINLFNGIRKNVTYTKSHSGERPIIDLEPNTYATGIILKSNNIVEPLGIELLTIMGKDTIHSGLFTKNKEIIMSNFIKDSDINEHLSKENIDNYNLDNFIYFDQESNTDTIFTIKKLLIVMQLCAHTNKKLVLESKSWLFDYLNDITEYTIDIEDKFLSFEPITEENANLVMGPCHKMRLFNSSSYEILAKESSNNIFKTLAKNFLKFKKELYEERNVFYEEHIKPHKKSIVVNYMIKDNNNIVHNKVINHPYNLVKRLINNVYSNIINDDICIYVSTDDELFLEYMDKEFGGKCTIKYLENNSTHKQNLVNILIMLKCDNLILADDNHSNFVKCLGNQEFININNIMV